MKISIIGAGYVGLVTGLCLAKLGNAVTFIDTDERKIKALNNKNLPIYEEGLEELLNSVDIVASLDINEVLKSEAIFICVGTPCDCNGDIAPEQVKKATEEISNALRKKKEYSVVCVRSTVAPGTTEQVVMPILEKWGKQAGKDFGVCMSPEFLREGKAVYDFMNPARIIIGEHDKRAGDMLMSLYTAHFKAPILRTDLSTAEMIKLASNAFLATKISFTNELGNICKKLNIDVYEVTKGMGLDGRIGDKFLNAGVGFGGSCLPKDVRGLISKSRQVGYNPKMLQEVLNLNEEQPLRIVELLKRHVTLKDTTIGVLGLAFKPETDDVRDSRAINVVEALLKQGAVVKAYDPVAAENFKKLFPQIAYVSKEEALNSDAIVILTEWKEFNQLDYTGKIVVDGRRIEKAKDARIYEGLCW